MIQRIQSLFLLLSGAGFFALLGLPFAESDQVADPYFQDKLLQVTDHTILLVLAIGGGILSLAAIFLFNNRSLQQRISYLVIIFSLFMGLAVVWLAFIQGDNYEPKVELTDKMGLYMPAISLIAAILASYFIGKDEKLVKSMDRLR